MPASANQVPRTAYDRTGGIVYFGRMLDKIRFRAAGTLRPDFLDNMAGGFDVRCCKFLGMTYPFLHDRVMAGGSDPEILAWCQVTGRRPDDEQIFVWNLFMEKRGWRDDSTQELEDYKAASGIAHRTDLLTFFDYYEVDEGRSPGP